MPLHVSTTTTHVRSHLNKIYKLRLEVVNLQVPATLLLLAVVVEQVVTILKGAFPNIRNSYSQLAAMGIGIALCISSQMGVLGELKVPVAYPLVDYIITGLLISRGSNLVHDLFHGISSYTRSLRTQKGPNL